MGMELEALISKIKSYHPDADISLLQKAYEFSKDKHGTQKRQSGDPYILHPLMVASILADLRMDVATIITGLLHDTLEDTHATTDEVERLFGREVLELVEGVTKISKITFRTSEEKQAENFRKMLVAMAKDIRVVIVKLADRLHNMRTLQHLPAPKQLQIAKETLDIYAPLANRLGISWIKIEFEDFCLRYLKPEAYYKLVKMVAMKKKERQDYIDQVKKMVHMKLSDHGLAQYEVAGRPKHFYSIYKKMEISNLSFEQIHDLMAFRIIVDTVTQCYEALGVVHSMWKPVPGRFKDYIAMPKPNLYRSLHTTVIGPGGERVEIQIRTREMNEIAELGVAAHWKYKEENQKMKADAQFEWLRRLVQWQEEKDPVVFLESVKMDLFQSEIYVFTPRGDVMEFPDGSTPLDFAYAVHTNVGHACTGAKVNGKIVPLKYELKSGDTVEIITSTTQRPTKDWLKVAKTSRAKSKIRSYIQQQEREEAKVIGLDLIERNFKRFGLNYNTFRKDGSLDRIAKDFGGTSADDLIVKLGIGKVNIEKLLEKFVSKEQLASLQKPEDQTFLTKVFKKVAEKTKTRAGIRVMGVDDMLIRFAKCCAPLPGDPIVGFITRGRGVSVHTLDCPTVLESDENRRIDVMWEKGVLLERTVRIKVICEDVPGALTAMSKAISNENVNIMHAECSTTKDRKGVNLFDVNVKDTEHLNKLMQQLEKLRGVISVERVRQG